MEARFARGRMRWLAVGAVTALAVGLSACGAGGAATTTSQAATVQLSNNSTLGSILVDTGGMTLYRFHKDSVNKSVCTATCAGLWPPLVVSGKPSAASGVTGKLGTLKRSNGQEQVTCDGYPLYTYSGDKAAGDTTGQGYLGLWNAVSASCGLVTKGISSSTTAGAAAKTSSTATTTAKATTTATKSSTSSGGWG